MTPTRTIQSLLGAMLLLALTPATPAAEVPFGHADWRASPTNPVGFAGQGNNWYPGATPPTEWSDTTNAAPKNIRWKVPIPGWTDAPPIVVGHPAKGGTGRVIGLYSPHHIVCYDADTGQVLWQDELKLMSLPVLSKDGQTLQPPAVDAAKQQEWFERAISLVRLHAATWLHYRGRQFLDRLEERRPLVQHIAETLEGWRAHLQRDFPDLVPALDKDLEFYRMALTKTPEEIRTITADLRNGHGVFSAAVAKKLGLVALHNNWQGSISDVAATPVSDGEVVCLTMGFGQVASYELATGKRLWAWRHPRMNPGPVNHVASPLLWKDLLLIPAPAMAGEGGKHNGRPWNQMSLMALDKRTGAIRWETLDQRITGGETGWLPGGVHGVHESPHLVRLPGERALAISGTGHIVDAETGVSLGQLPGHERPVGECGHGFTTSIGARVYRGSGGDNFNPPVLMHEVKLTGSNTAELAAGPPMAGTPGQGPFVVTDRLLVVGKTVAEAATGTKLAELSNAGISIVAGQYVLGASQRMTTRDSVKGGGSGVLTLTTHVVDLTDPAHPKTVATNTITAVGYTPDISAKYFPRYAADPALRKWGALDSGHCNYQGIGFSFAADTAGLTAHGHRLYLHSPSWLYCIGEK